MAAPDPTAEPTPPLATRLAHLEWLCTTVIQDRAGRNRHSVTWQEWASDRGLAPNPMRHLCRLRTDPAHRPRLR